MARALAESIVRYLSLRDEAGLSDAQFPAASARAWNRALTWLDHSGLALYFLQRLTARKATARIPPNVLFELEQRKQENQLRVASMRGTFAAINRGFEDAAVRYAVLKGFSLVPEYCSDASLRSQSDFDYLIEPGSAALAQRVLSEQGYVLKKQTGNEFIFWIPSAEATRPRQQYSPRAPWVVELQLTVWDSSLFRVPIAFPDHRFDRMGIHEWDGLRFPCLTPEEMFLGQLMHAFRHVLWGWVRLSWLFEISFFLHHRIEDTALWAQLDQLVGDQPLLKECMAVIALMAADIFDAPIPPALREWSNSIRPSVNVWLRNYSRDWLFQKFPRQQFSLFSPAKLVLFLQEQYLPNRQTRTGEQRRVLFPWARLRRLAQPPSVPGTTAIGAIKEKCRWLALHLIYHFGANLRYLRELPRWRHLNKLQTSHRRVSGLHEKI
jgi:Uncharacterised nucleotidyltransferase